MDWTFGNPRAQSIGFANRLPCLEPTSGDDTATNLRPVVPAGILVDARRATKLTPGDDSDILV